MYLSILDALLWGIGGRTLTPLTQLNTIVCPMPLRCIVFVVIQTYSSVFGHEEPNIFSDKIRKEEIVFSYTFMNCLDAGHVFPKTCPDQIFCQVFLSTTQANPQHNESLKLYQ